MTDAIASTALSVPRRGIAAWANLLRQSIAAQWPILVLPVLFLGANELILATLDEPRRATFLALIKGMVTVILPVALFAILILRLVVMPVYERPASPIRALIADIKSLACPVRLANALPIVTAVLLCNKAMLDIKMNIPALHPFSWDETLMQIDRQLHGGIDPWIWLQPVIGYPPITFVISILYSFWFFVLFGTWVYFAFRPTFEAARLQFFLAYMIAWSIGGAFLALLFSSAGPVYYGSIGLSPDPFAPLLNYLHAADAMIPIWSIDTQQMLWNGYTGKADFFAGISAFPSMHNAMVTLFALMGWRVHRTVGILLTIYAAIIMIGSVHLAWHYAVDSYAGVIVAVLSWWIAGRLVQWNMGLPHVREYRSALERLAR